MWGLAPLAVSATTIPDRDHSKPDNVEEYSISEKTSLIISIRFKLENNDSRNLSSPLLLPYGYERNQVRSN